MVVELEYEVAGETEHHEVAVEPVVVEECNCKSWCNRPHPKGSFWNCLHSGETTP